jgi:hypothetical protein
LVLVAPAPARLAAVVTEEYRQCLVHAYDSPETVGNALDHVLTTVAVSQPVRNAVVRDSLAASADARTEWPLRGIAQDITKEARHIETPVAVLAGEHDKVEPPNVLRECLLPYVPHATMTTVPRRRAPAASGGSRSGRGRPGRLPRNRPQLRTRMQGTPARGELITVEVAGAFSMAETAAAHRASEKGHTCGKFVVVVGDERD